MATLENVTPREREAAMGMLSQMTGKPNATKENSDRAARTTTKQTSPAEALLSRVPSSIDSIELTNGYASERDSNSFSNRSQNSPYPSSSNPADFEDRFLPVQTQTENPFQVPSWIPTWQQWSGEELARLLNNERPTLIAAVLLQAPVELGSEILQSLPAPIATSVLAVLPQLHTTDSSVLQEIYSQLHQRLSDFQRQSSPENAGMTKLQAILSTVSNETRLRLEQGLTIAEPLLAHALGLSSGKATPAAVSTPITAAKTIDYHAVDMANEADRDEEALPSTLPFPSNANDEDGHGASQESILSFENLTTLSLEDLAIVLRSMDPNTILLAASGASREMQNRIEALVDPKEVKRLRARLQSLRAAKTIEKQAAQKKIAQAAHVLIQQGRIAILANMTILAAA